MISSLSESARAARRRRYGPSLIERVAQAVGLDPSEAPRLVGRVVRRTALAAVVLVVLVVVLRPELEPISRLLVQLGGESG